MKTFRQHIALKSISGIILLLILFAVILGRIGYQDFKEVLLEQYAEDTFLIARSAVEFVDADRIDDFRQEGPETEAYQTVLKQLDWLCNSQGAAFIYVILPDRSDYAHITFLFSVMDHTKNYDLFEFGYVRETSNEEYRKKYRALCEEGSGQELVIRDKGYITTDPHITAMLPLRGADGGVNAILCVQRQMEALAKSRRRFLREMTMAMITLFLLVIAGQSAFLNHTVLRPLKQIATEAKRFSTEDIKPGRKLQEMIRSEDEVGALAVSIDRMEEQIQTHVENLTRITAEKQRIITELELAERIQASMLPDQFPAFPDRKEFDLFASMDPAREVGGDFYDFFLIDEDHLCLVIADVSGKGVPAALFMMASKITLTSNAMFGKSPAFILADTNAAICRQNREDMFVTVWLGILEISTGRLTAANAGHEYPMIKGPAGRFELLKDKHGMALGFSDIAAYKEYELILEPGTKLFLYTDGVPEATDTQDRMFRTERMLSALNDKPDASPEQILKQMRETVDAFVGDAEQFDDITMLCVEYKGHTRRNDT